MLVLSFCVLVAISPRRAKPGGLPHGMRSAGTLPPPAPAAGAPPAGPWQEPNWVYSYVNHVGSRSHMVNDNIAGYRLEIFTTQELLQSVTLLTRCPRLALPDLALVLGPIRFCCLPVTRI